MALVGILSLHPAASEGTSQADKLLPQAPRNVHAAFFDGKVARLTWTNAGDPEVDFVVEQSTDGKTWTISSLVRRDESHALINGLDQSATWFFRVRASNRETRSSASRPTVVQNHGHLSPGIAQRASAKTGSPEKPARLAGKGRSFPAASKNPPL